MYYPVTQCASSIHVRLYTKFTDKNELEFVNSCSLAEKLRVHLVIFTLLCLKLEFAV